MMLAVLLAGCVVEPVEPDPPSKPRSCGADQMQGLVGQPARVLQTMKFGQVVRVIRPGQAVTMDYSEERLNIEVNAAEVISRVSCG